MFGDNSVVYCSPNPKLSANCKVFSGYSVWLLLKLDSKCLCYGQMSVSLNNNNSASILWNNIALKALKESVMDPPALGYPKHQIPFFFFMYEQERNAYTNGKPHACVVITFTLLLFLCLSWTESLCLMLTDHLLILRDALQEIPLGNTAFSWFSGRSYLTGDSGTYCAGYTIATPFDVIESASLPMGTSTQEAESGTVTWVYTLAKNTTAIFLYL